MDENARLQLQKMIQVNNVEDQTELIRQLKHSHILRKDIETLLALKRSMGSDDESLHLDAMMDCQFLFTYYTDIYNKVRKDEIDLTILFRFLDVLQKIEDGDLDQHEGSFVVGTLLKELYVDSALKRAEKLDKENSFDENEKIEPIPIHWKEFKNIINR
jgi:hypothetical protein